MDSYQSFPTLPACIAGLPTLYTSHLTRAQRRVPRILHAYFIADDVAHDLSIMPAYGLGLMDSGIVPD